MPIQCQGIGAVCQRVGGGTVHRVGTGGEARVLPALIGPGAVIYLAANGSRRNRLQPAPIYPHGRGAGHWAFGTHHAPVDPAA